jgi:hypothetical protein
MFSICAEASTAAGEPHSTMLTLVPDAPSVMTGLHISQIRNSVKTSSFQGVHDTGGLEAMMTATNWSCLWRLVCCCACSFLRPTPL